MTAAVPLIFKKIADVMKDIDAIGKIRRNTQGSGYNFRGIDDVYNELHTPLAMHGVFTIPTVLEERSEERQSKSGGTLIYRIMKIKYSFFAEDGSSIEAIVIGEGMDSGDKASNKAMSVAHKYAIIQVFAIPTEEAKDPEDESHDVAPRPQPKQQMPGAGNQEVRKASIYTGTEDQQKIVGEILKKLEVPEEHWSAIHERLLNRPSTDLRAAIDEVTKP